MKYIKELQILKQERNKLENTIQKEFEQDLNYIDKFKKIYDLLLKSQSYYQKYILNDILNQSNLDNLLAELESIQNLDDIKFYNFINEKIIKPLNSGHVSVKFDNKYLNYLNEVYEILKNNYDKSNIKVFLETHSIEELQYELLSIPNMDDNEFKKILNEKIFSEVDIAELNIKKKENLSYQIKDNKLVIKLESFSRKYLNEDIPKLNEIEERLNQENFEDIIIDIRGNMGGTDEYFKYFSMLSNRSIVENSEWYNLFTSQNEGYSFEAIPKGTEKEYNIYLVVDNKVFSTAESFAKLCQNTRFATIIGEDTHGEGYGMTPISIELSKNIPIILTFPIEAPINEFGEIDYSKYNTKPDIQCSKDCTIEEIIEIVNNINDRSKTSHK